MASAARGPLRAPGSLPFPTLPEGTDTLPQIENIVVLMMENHSFDNYFGMLGRGDGFTLKNGQPHHANPDGAGNLIHAFHMPSTCQLSGHPGQNWNASHLSLQHHNRGFVKASGPVAMGYWDGTDIPFYYGLGSTFPLADRWFGSCLAQTYPNRRFLLCGTAAGIVETSNAALTSHLPPNGNIMQRLDALGVSWGDYYSDLPGVAVLLHYSFTHPQNLHPIDQFFVDVAAGTLPSVTFVDPNFDNVSEENPQDLRRGEQFASQVINAVMAGPKWSKTVLIWCYDEHGGYYDHVHPPRAIRPDDIPPDIEVPPDFPGGYDRYGFRIPAVVVSPYAKMNYVSHVVRDHTAVLGLIERKWNIGAMTFRDANADDLLDMLDFDNPAFLEPPALPAPALDAGPDTCTPGDPGGPIPPPEAVTQRGWRERLEAGEIAFT